MGKKNKEGKIALYHSQGIFDTVVVVKMLFFYQLSVVMGCKEGTQCARKGKRKDLIIAIGFMRKEVLSRRPFNLSDTLRYTTLPKVFTRFTSILTRVTSRS